MTCRTNQFILKADPKDQTAQAVFDKPYFEKLRFSFRGNSPLAWTKYQDEILQNPLGSPLMILRGLRLYLMLLREWDRIRKKDWFHRLPQSPYELEQGRASLFFRIILSLLRGSSLPFSKPLTLKIITLDKPRELIEMPLEAHLIHGLIRQILKPSIESRHSLHAHSFIKGRSVKTAFEQIQKQLKHYRKKTKQKNRALFVLRADIKKCGESIPIHPRSRIWTLLTQICPDTRIFSREEFQKLLTQCLRPDLEWKGTPGAFQLRYGIPTGSPLQPLMLNLYLGEIDRYFETHLSENQFAMYSRYGDDFFFAHPDEAKFIEIKDGFLRLVTDLELEIRPEKIKSFRWSGSGFQGRSRVEFLGYELCFNGTLRINREKQNLLAGFLRHLVRRCFTVMKDHPLEDRVEATRSLLERALGFTRRSRHPYVDKLLGLGNDRGQLQEIDHTISLAMAEVISGKSGVRAYRKVRKRELYRTHRIPSMVGRRNQA